MDQIDSIFTASSSSTSKVSTSASSVQSSSSSSVIATKIQQACELCGKHPEVPCLSCPVSSSRSVTTVQSNSHSYANNSLLLNEQLNQTQNDFQNFDLNFTNHTQQNYPNSNHNNESKFLKDQQQISRGGGTDLEFTHKLSLENKNPIHIATERDPVKKQSEEFFDASSEFDENEFNKLNKNAQVKIDDDSKTLAKKSDESEIFDPTTIPKQHRHHRHSGRKKWCCCCCQKKKAAGREMSGGDQSGAGNNNYASSLYPGEDDASIESSVYSGCLGGLLSTDPVLGEVDNNHTDDPQLKNALHPGGFQRRTKISDRPNYSLSLWSIIKNAIGKDLTKVALPVNFSEPLSMLQRLTEDYEYSAILDRASECTDSAEQMCYVAAFTISSYATTAIRTGKPFNPLLGETFECDRRDDLGWRCISEQVSHHPPTAALYCEGNNGWQCWQEFTMSSKFRGNYLEIIPLGIAHLQFKDGNHYTWRKVSTIVHNLVVGKLWVEQTGDMVLTNHTTGERCQLKYIPYSMFNKKQKEVIGSVIDANGYVQWHINGTWDSKVDAWKRKIPKKLESKASQKTLNELSNGIGLWSRRYPPQESEKYYNFTEFACQLNELEDGVAPTDSRLRPDQRLMEEGDFDSANLEKVRLEEKQRAARKQWGEDENYYRPSWFTKEKDPIEGSMIHVYKGEYWSCKKAGDWKRCPDIF